MVKKYPKRDAYLIETKQFYDAMKHAKVYIDALATGQGIGFSLNEVIRVGQELSVALATIDRLRDGAVGKGGIADAGGSSKG